MLNYIKKKILTDLFSCSTHFSDYSNYLYKSCLRKINVAVNSAHSIPFSLLSASPKKTTRIESPQLLIEHLAYGNHIHICDAPFIVLSTKKKKNTYKLGGTILPKLNQVHTFRTSYPKLSCCCAGALRPGVIYIACRFLIKLARGLHHA